jgi:hypothetical protein
MLFIVQFLRDAILSHQYGRAEEKSKAKCHSAGAGPAPNSVDGGKSSIEVGLQLV